jgi:alpha-1,6-mannosyltransferase
LSSLQLTTQFNSVVTWLNLGLVALGGGSFILYRYSLHGLQADSQGLDYIVWFIKLALVQSGVYVAAAWVVWRACSSPSTVLIVVIFAALFRLSILFAPPLLSDDVYRYVWDGRVQAAGVNPYRYIPADEALAPLRDKAIYPKINRRDFAPTMYPPVAEGIYLLTTRISESVTWMKATMVGFEVITMWALMALLASLGLPRQRVLIYAWHPLIVWEFAGSGHVDAVAISFIAVALLTRRRGLEAATGFALASAALVKFYPAILFPAFYRRWGWKMPVVFGLTVILAYVPYLTVGAQGVLGYLPGYMAEEGMRNGERFFILTLARRLFSGASLPLTAFLIFAGLILATVAVRFLWRREPNESRYVGRALTLAAIFTILLSPRYAWYYTWIIPFLCVVPFPSLFYVTSASFILYAFWLGEAERRLTIDLTLYAPFAIITAMTFWMRRKRWKKIRGEPPAQLEKEPA